MTDSTHEPEHAADDSQPADPGSPAEFGDAELDDAAWDLLADCLQEFSDAWQAAENRIDEIPDQPRSVESSTCPIATVDAPELRHFLPASCANLRAVTLVELIKLDMEFRTRWPGQWKSLEQFREEFPEIAAGDRLPADLVYEEFQLRKQMDGGAAAAEYQERFPNEFGSLTRLINEDTAGSSALYKPRSTVSFDVGDRVDDFDLLTRLGRGAFATVFLARQNSMQRIVALKISADQGHEPQMLAQLDHPHIVRVYDQRVIDDPAVRLMYMQHVAGGSLQEAFASARKIAEGESLSGKHLVAAVDQFLNLRGEAIPVESENRKRLARSTWDQVVSQIGKEIAQALGYAHERKVLHRDLKPANVLLDKDCHVKLVDFNISFCSKLDGASPAAYFGGSMAYMSQEQLEACNPDHDRTPDQLDGRSDIFSVGVMLYELLTGCRPFDDPMSPGNWSDTLAKMISDRRSGLSQEARARLQSHSPILGNAIIRCLQGARADRFPDGQSLQDHLSWAMNPQAVTLFQPRSDPASRFALATPFWTVGILTMGMSAAAVQFISTYNLDISVPDGAGGEPGQMGLFQKIMIVTNLFWFGLGGFIIFLLTRPIVRCLSVSPKEPPPDATTVDRAIHRNLMLGHYTSIMSVTEWTLGGILYPVAFLLFGYEMTNRMSFDFIASHMISGLITGAYVFWTVSFFALHVWQPRLLEMALQQDARLDWSREHQTLEQWTGFYHVLAIAVPIVAIAGIVLFSNHETDQRSLTVLSIIALLGLVLLVWTSRRVRYWIGLQRGFNPVRDS